MDKKKCDKITKRFLSDPNPCQPCTNPLKAKVPEEYKKIVKVEKFHFGK